MVLCQETEHVLLDETLSNLDIAHSVEMMQHLGSAATELGRTIVIVLHDINFAARYADFTCAAKDGAIAAFGARPRLCAMTPSPRFSMRRCR